ncbi:MAG: InlB B-repeat-containing protein, partial [Anaerovoracaceae bacterium]
DPMPNSFVTKAGSLPDISSESYIVNKTSVYSEPTNSFDDGGTSYYLLTQDTNKNLTNTPSVSYEGKTYNLSGVIVSNKCTAMPSLSASNLPNRTYFIEDGEYDNDLVYNILQSNLSLVGLGDSVKFNRVTTAGATSPNVERIALSGANMYIANIIFDGRAQNLTTNSGRGISCFVVANTADNLVMKGCKIQNIGASTLGTSTNAALLFNYGQNKVNIIDLTVEKLRTQTYGALYSNQANNINIKNLNIDYSTSSANCYGVRFEHTATTYGAFPNYGVAFDGNNVTSGGFIAFQDYRYNPVSVPVDDYRYMEFKTTNGNGSGTSGYAYRLWKNIPASATNNAIFDRLDNYWIVRQAESVTVNNQLAYINTVRTLLAGSMALSPNNIPGVNIKFITKGNDISSLTVPNYGNSTAVNIVSLRSIDDEYNSFEFCPVADNATITLNATNTSNVTFHNFDFASKSKRTLSSVVNGVSIDTALVTDSHNGDYPTGDKVAYSDYAKTVPKMVSAGATQVEPTQFMNCAFVGLPSKLVVTADKAAIPIGGTLTVTAAASSPWTISPELPLTQKAVNNDGKVYYYSSDLSIATVDKETGLVTSVGLGEVTIYAKVVDSYNNGEIEKPYEQIKINIYPVFAVEIDVKKDNSIWNNSGKSFKLIDKLTGVEFTNFLEMPNGNYEIWELTSTQPVDTKVVVNVNGSNVSALVNYYTVTYNANLGTGTLQDVYSPYLENSSVMVLQNTFTRKGYTFIGWNQLPSNLGRKYNSGDTFTIIEGMTLYAQWRLIPPVDPPVKPPVDPPIKPPVDPPVKPPVDPPVNPPVEEPNIPPLTEANADIQPNKELGEKLVKKSDGTYELVDKNGLVLGSYYYDKETKKWIFVKAAKPDEIREAKVWALINLLLMIISIITSIFITVKHLLHMAETQKQNSFFEEKTEESLQRENRNKILMIICMLAISILSVIVFIITEDMSLPMGLMDKWTILMLLFPIMQFILLMINRMRYHVKKESE